MSIAQGGRFGRKLMIAVQFLLSLLLFSVASTAANAEALSELVTAEYVIDDIPGLGSGHLIAIDQTQEFNLAYIIENIRAPELAKGVHTIAIRFQNEDGDWSTAIQQSFYWPGYNGPVGSNSHLNPLIKGEIFFDDIEMEVGTGTDLELAADGYLDTNFERIQRIASILGISAGQHSVSIKLLDSSGIWSAALTQSYYVYRDDLSTENSGDGVIQPDETYAGDNDNNGWFFPSRINHVKQAIAYYDDNPTNFIEITLPSEQDIASGSAFNNFNSLATTTDLTTGVHSFHLSFQDNTGEWSQPIAQSILINPTHLVTIGQSGNRIQAARYSVDDGNTVNLTAQDGAFDDIFETIEKNQAVSQAFHSVKVDFLDLSGQWTDPLNNVMEPMENDSDGNGISDQWELTWFGQVGIDPSSDHDNDGITNLEEFLQGKHPLIDDNQTALTISGYVKDPQGNGISHVLVCLDTDQNCTIRTDIYGHYILGLTEVLTSTQHTVLVKSSSASGLMAFPPARTVTLGSSSIERINFTSTEVQLTWSFVANEQYNPGDNIELQWQSNVAKNLGVSIELKRESAEAILSEPDNVDWYQYSTFADNDGLINIVIPEGLNFADDWHITLSLVGSSQPVLSSSTFKLTPIAVPVPVVEINMTSLANPTAAELITASVKNLDETHFLTANHWSAVRLSAGEETGERILLSEESTLRTEQLTAGDWRLYLQAKDESGQWSEAVSKDIYVNAIEGLADLAINQTAVQVINQQGEKTYTVEQNEAVTVQVTVTNTGTVELPDKAWVIVRDGIGEGSTTLGRVKVESLAAGAETTVDVPITASADTGYQTITVDVQFDGNIGVYLDQLTVAEANRANNAASIFLIVGNPPAGSFGIDLTTPEIFTVYPGQSTYIHGQAEYSFGARIPLMGTQVYIDLEQQQQQTGRTTSPAGDFAVRVKASEDLGDYIVNITVNGGYMPPARKTVILRVIPWPTVAQWVPSIGTYIDPPPRPTPITDLRLKHLTLSGESYYATDKGVQALVQNTEATLHATIHNNGNLPVTDAFKVSFYYFDDSEENGKQVIGESVIVDQSLAVNQYIQVSSLLTVSFEQLGYRQIFAEITEVANENNFDNNKNSITFDVRANRPDLRGSSSNTISSVRFSNRRPIPGENIRIFADVYNLGPAQLNGSFTVNFYDGNPLSGLLIDSATFSGSLNKWQTTTLAVNWSATTEGSYSIHAVIDVNNTIDEDAEDNNIISGSLSVIPDIADLHVALNLSDYSVNPGTNITLNGVITNNGTQTSEPTNVTFYFGDPNNGGDVISSVLLTQLNSKTSEPVSVDWNTLIPHGNHKICLVIESNSQQSCQTLHISDIPVPDLQVYSEDITYVPGPYPEVDSQVLVSANIRNVSAYRNAQNITVQFYADSPTGFFQIGEPVQIDEIAIQGSAEVTATDAFTTNQPYYALKVEVIPSAEDGEANLTDNAATTAFFVNGYVYSTLWAQDHQITTPIGEKISINLFGNNFIFDNENILFELEKEPVNGTVEFSNEGIFTYTPNSNYAGPEKLVYSLAYKGISDSIVKGNVDITVDPKMPWYPQFTSLPIVVLQGPIVGLKLPILPQEEHASLVDNYEITYIEPSKNGKIALVDGKMNFMPNSDFLGEEKINYLIVHHGTTIRSAVLPVIVRDSQDEDGDSIPDSWEGVANLDGVDLSKSEIGKKDIYLWIDHMYNDACQNVPKNYSDENCKIFDAKPSQKAVDLVIEAFQRRGINLHVEFGKERNRVPERLYIPAGEVIFGDCDDESNLTYRTDTAINNSINLDCGLSFFKKINFWKIGNDILINKNRERVYHYMLLGHELIDVKYEDEDPKEYKLESSLASGRMESKYNATFVSNYKTTENTFSLALVIMHELGHTLGLGHGGPWNINYGEGVYETGNENYKPNHLSIMNYLYSNGLFRLPGGDISKFSDASVVLDYAQVGFSEINENDLPASLKVEIPCDSNKLVCDFDIQEFNLDYRFKKNSPDYHACDIYDSKGNEYCDAQLDWSSIEWKGAKINSSGKLVGEVNPDLRYSTFRFSRLVSRPDWNNLIYGGYNIGDPKGVKLGEERRDVWDINNISGSLYFPSIMDIDEPSIDEIIVPTNYRLALSSVRQRVFLMIGENQAALAFLLENKGEMADSYDISYTKSARTFGNDTIIASKISGPNIVHLNPGEGVYLNVEIELAEDISAGDELEVIVNVLSKKRSSMQGQKFGIIRITDEYFEDSDNDGIPDDIELEQGTDPNNADADGDGLIDSQDPEPNTPNPVESAPLAPSWVDITDNLTIDKSRGVYNRMLNKISSILKVNNTSGQKYDGLIRVELVGSNIALSMESDGQLENGNHYWDIPMDSASFAINEQFSKQLNFALSRVRLAYEIKVHIKN